MTAPDYGKIQLLVLDADGVLTDGRVTLTADGRESSSFHVRDGTAMKYWKRLGKKLAIISGRDNRAVARYAEELQVDAIRLNAKDKLPAFEQLLSELDVTAEQTAVVGDDLPDLPLLRRAGFGVAAADAAGELRAAADYVSEAPGGCGCVREVIELILKATGGWRRILSRYLGENEEQAR